MNHFNGRNVRETLSFPPFARSEADHAAQAAANEQWRRDIETRLTPLPKDKLVMVSTPGKWPNAYEQLAAEMPDSFKRHEGRGREGDGAHAITMFEPPLRINPTILTSEGEYLHFLEPDPRAISMTTIAHALSNICRFTGHSRYHYSVAQHSVLVSYLVPEEYAFQGLMHDAAEAFVGDVSSPLKQLIPGYKEIEKRIEAAVAERFGLPAQLHPSVKAADLVALKMEREQLMPNGDGSVHWQLLDGVTTRPGFNYMLNPMRPRFAKREFIRRFISLTEG